MSRLSDLKKNRNKMFEEILDAANKMKSSGGGSKETDDRFWKPTLDKAGNSYAVIRFLPPLEGEDAWIEIFAHGFQNKETGVWLIENCPTTIKGKCPVCESNTQLWNSGVEKNKQVARDRKRKLSYISNIYVVSDPACPENEKKVFLFKYGKKIWDKLNEAMFPQFEDEDKMNPFCIFTGANFKLKVRKFEGYPNYDKSSFDSPSVLSNDDEELENILSQEHSLKEFLAPKNFKSYDELKNRLEMALSDAVNTPTKEVEEEEEDDLPANFLEPDEPKTVEKVQNKKSAKDLEEDADNNDKGKDMSKFFGLKDKNPTCSKSEQVDSDDDMEDFLRDLASRED